MEQHNQTELVRIAENAVATVEAAPRAAGIPAAIQVGSLVLRLVSMVAGKLAPQMAPASVGSRVVILVSMVDGGPAAMVDILVAVGIGNPDEEALEPGLAHIWHRNADWNQLQRHNVDKNEGNSVP
jgi:hypothetical protein